MGAPGSWMASYGSEPLDPQAAQSRLAEAAAGPTAAAAGAARHCSSAAAAAAAAAAGKRRWKTLLGSVRLLGALVTWFCLLLSVASLLQIKPAGALQVLQVAAPVAAVLLFLSPGAAAKRALRDADTTSLPAVVFAAQAVSCAVALVYGMQINSNAIFITNAMGFAAVWALWLRTTD
ncbi:hypothetical protein, conserved [Eimeria tenella]|uniref:Uncharacterized protein n=1 Tax=Eimeria tenella TaxID=5802 RepID=U6KNM5_EIMTE|nr:hypothetical protein, conserved [Eimeria tenella]CDJ38416.1 hypothetical protein, conserved [Eimeria tenella]|eukprot:XP_013229254.1 hypothetical protein, conserved [Eimeria tenella]